MHIEKIEYGPEKEGLWSQVAFALIILLTFVAAGITGLIFWKILSSDAAGCINKTIHGRRRKVTSHISCLTWQLSYTCMLKDCCKMNTLQRWSDNMNDKITFTITRRKLTEIFMGLVALFFAGGALASILKYLWPATAAKGEVR